MVVVFEFLSREPIENVITAMNFQVDRLVFFGNHEDIIFQKEKTENFLRKYCAVQSIIFLPLSGSNLQSVLQTMRKEIESELSKNAKLFFDITGGESLMLVAFGMLSREYETPMHMYDIYKGKLLELNSESLHYDERNTEAINKDNRNADDSALASPNEKQHLSISSIATKRPVPMTLDKLIEMHGGVINYKLQKDIKDVPDEESREDILKIRKVMKLHSEHWNPFSEFLRENMNPDEEGRVYRKESTVLKALADSSNKLKSAHKFYQIMEDLARAGAILDLKHSEGKYQFRFKNKAIKGYLWDGGSILELYSFLQEKGHSDECRVGVHLDWDGVLEGPSGIDVLNEIDVLSLQGYIPSFISCKSGKLSPQQCLHALYELDTVANRFGGKYAKKRLVVTSEINEVYQERALEMGIELKVE
ncbi:hypothetical protein [Oribacterium sinus]|uniref:hypothetical protein n=1 Tax=Oribacterium sinus TaxID=237576 RepID=UPI0028EBFB09|nr:hypothetical protein [Oribacterium sinus]